MCAPRRTFRPISPHHNRQCWSASAPANVLLEAVDVEADRLANFTLGVFYRPAGRDAAGQVRQIGE
jgi:hypothetical protein